MISFNINDFVFVRLTEAGRQWDRQRHDTIFGYLTPKEHFVYEPPKEDAEGWSKWQMWQLMEVFGSRIHLASQPMFDGTIRLDEKDLTPVVSNNPQVLKSGLEILELPNNEVRRMRLGEGDIVVIRSPDKLSQQARADIMQRACMLFPNNKVLVLDAGMSIEVVEQPADFRTIDASGMDASTVAKVIGPSVEPNMPKLKTLPSPVVVPHELVDGGSLDPDRQLNEPIKRDAQRQGREFI